MQRTSGSMEKETVHFEASSADKVSLEMNAFLEWFNANQEMGPILKATFAHLWFVTIHLVKMAPDV